VVSVANSDIRGLISLDKIHSKVWAHLPDRPKPYGSNNQVRNADLRAIPNNRGLYLTRRSVVADSICRYADCVGRKG
jgi:hypothetical protein